MPLQYNSSKTTAELCQGTSPNLCQGTSSNMTYRARSMRDLPVRLQSESQIKLTLPGEMRNIETLHVTWGYTKTHDLTEMSEAQGELCLVMMDATWRELGASGELSHLTLSLHPVCESLI